MWWLACVCIRFISREMCCCLVQQQTDSSVCTPAISHRYEYIYQQLGQCVIKNQNFQFQPNTWYSTLSSLWFLWLTTVNVSVNTIKQLLSQVPMCFWLHWHCGLCWVTVVLLLNPNRLRCFRLRNNKTLLHVCSQTLALSQPILLWLNNLCQITSDQRRASQ